MRRWFLPALALLAFVALLVAPQTGWLARRQVRLVWLNQGEAEIKRLAAAPWPIPATPARDAAWKLDKLCEERLQIRRADLDDAARPYVKPRPERLPADVRAEALALCDQGERSDPTNAFFSRLRAATYLASFEDEKAIAELHRTANLTRFTSYQKDKDRSVAMQARAHGGGLTDSAVPLRLSQKSAGFYHPVLSALYFNAMSLALKRQAAGDLIGGIEVRRDLRRIYDNTGLLPQRDLAASSPYWDYGGPSLWSIAGRAPLSLEISPKEAADRYVAFLKLNGGAGEAQAFQASLGREAQREREFDAWRKQAISSEYRLGGEVFALNERSQAGQTLLAGVIATLLCGALAYLMRFTQSEEATKKQRTRMLWAFLALAYLLGSFCFDPVADAMDAWSKYADGDSWPDFPSLWMQVLFARLGRWAQNAPYIVVVLFPTLLLLLGGGIQALVKRRPTNQGMLGAASKGAIPAASLVLLLWCATVIGLARDEVRQLAEFEATFRAEAPPAR